MTGVVLCGGQSSRMGTDKGLLPSSDTSWAGIAADKIMATGIPVVFSINAPQRAVYAIRFPEIFMIVDQEGLPIKGPAVGILSVHLQFPSEDLLVLACDMPMMETDLLQTIIGAASSQPGSDIYIFENKNEWEPLCGLYTAGALDSIYKRLQQGILTRFSMKYLLENCHTHAIPVPEHREHCFTNCNSPEDLLPTNPGSTR